VDSLFCNTIKYELECKVNLQELVQVNLALRLDQTMNNQLPKVVQDCHDLLLWLIPLLDKFPRSRRFTLGERLENGLLDILADLIEAT